MTSGPILLPGGRFTVIYNEHVLLGISFHNFYAYFIYGTERENKLMG